MPLPLAIALAGLALSAASTGYGIGSSISANKKKKKFEAQAEKDIYGRPKMPNDPAVQEQLNAARAQYGAPNPALAAAYGQAQQQQANQMAFAQRNASSGAQALQAGADATANTQSILPALANEQTKYNMMGLSNLNQALQGKTQDNRMRYEDSISAYGDLANYHLGRVGAAQQDKSQAIALGAQGLMGGLSTISQMQSTPTYTPDYGTQPSAVGSGGMLAGATTNGLGMGAPVQSGIAAGTMGGLQMSPYEYWLAKQRAYKTTPYGGIYN